MDRQSTALNAALLGGACLLITVPLAVGPDVRPDRVEFYVEGDWSDIDGQQNIRYEALSSTGQTAFDDARSSTPETVDDTVADAPNRLTPPPNGIDVYNVRYQGSFYLLQVKYLTDSADFLTQVLPRVVLGVGGILLGLVAGYREFA
jgi:hypothetical protein